MTNINFYLAVSNYAIDQDIHRNATSVDGTLALLVPIEYNHL